MKGKIYIPPNDPQRSYVDYEYKELQVCCSKCPVSISVLLKCPVCQCPHYSNNEPQYKQTQTHGLPILFAT